MSNKLLYESESVQTTSNLPVNVAELVEYICPFCAFCPFLSKNDFECHVQTKHQEIGSDTDDSTGNVEEDEIGENCTSYFSTSCYTFEKNWKKLKNSLVSSVAKTYGISAEPNSIFFQ